MVCLNNGKSQKKYEEYQTVLKGSELLLEHSFSVLNDSYYVNFIRLATDNHKPIEKLLKIITLSP